MKNAEAQKSIAYWLIVEKLSNWDADNRNAFRSYAISERFRKRVHEMKVGDLMVTYVAGVSAFADVRRVCSSVPRRITGKRGIYDRNLDWAIDTELVTSLDKESWIRIGSLVDELNLTRGKNWGPLLMTSLRRLEDPDARRIIEEFERRSRPTAVSDVARRAP